MRAGKHNDQKTRVMMLKLQKHGAKVKEHVREMSIRMELLLKDCCCSTDFWRTVVY
jgi:hypothetical protein